MGAFTSDQHHDVKLLRRLIGRRSSRFDDMLCVAEGHKVLSEVLAAGHRVRVVFVDGHSESDIAAKCVADGAVLRRLAPGLLAKLGDTVAPQPVMAIVESPLIELDTLAPTRPGLVIVGVDIADPGNAGTIIRSAELSGAVAAVFCGNSVDVTSPKVVRSSAGAVFHIPIVQTSDTAAVLDLLSAERFRLLGTALTDDAVEYSQPGILAGSVAVLLGNEAHGLSGEAANRVDAWITIPMVGRTESLNVAMAASIICFEAARQRRADGPPDD